MDPNSPMYREKYLKYKQKYLEIKKIEEGGMNLFKKMSPDEKKQKDAELAKLKEVKEAVTKNIIGIRDKIISEIKEKLVNANINPDKYKGILAPFENLFSKSKISINDGEIIKQINNVKFDATDKIDEDTFKVKLIKQLKVHFAKQVTKQNYSFNNDDDLNKILTKLAKSYIIPKIIDIFNTDKKSIDIVIEKIKKYNDTLNKINNDSYKNSVNFVNVPNDNVNKFKDNLDAKLKKIEDDINGINIQ